MGIAARHPRIEAHQLEQLTHPRTALGPAFLIADEPVSALDVSVQAQVVNLLMDLQQRLGLTLLLVAHDLRLVRHVCSRVAVMYRGRIVETGSAGAVLDTPVHPYTRALVSHWGQV